MELFGLDKAELSSVCEGLGHSAYRGKQIADWLYKRGARSFSQMTDLPTAMREQLTRAAAVTRSQVVEESRAKDGSSKFLLRLSDGETIESVLLPYPDRISVCVSTQIGCAAGCVFCATADSGFVRNLTAGEIVDQVITLQERAGARVTHVVFMGMGEPLLNLANVLAAVHILHNEVGISMRHMTISTVGITPAIRRLAGSELQLTLAISMHAPDDSLRRKLIPLARKFPLNELIEACADYADRTKRRVTFEYLLIGGVNDSSDHARSLAALLGKTLCHVNLIPYNQVPGKDFTRPSRRSVAHFREALERAGIEVSQRMERGHAVSAACGQLRRRVI